MTPSLRIVTERRGAGVVVRLDGEVDLATVPILRRRLSDAVRRTAHVVVDLAGVEFMSCGGVGALLDAREDAESRAGALRVVGPCMRPVARVLDLMRIGEQLDVERGAPGSGAGHTPTGAATL